MRTIQCDVLVVGGGPSGSTTAKHSASKGLKTIIIDAKKEIGYPVQCGEFVPKGLLMHLRDFPLDTIEKSIEKMRSIILGQGENTSASPGYMIDRARFDKTLMEQAIGYGAQLFPATKAIGHDYQGVLCSNNEDDILIKAKVIIGGDGPRSVVGRWLGLSNTNMMASLQLQFKMAREFNEIEFYFDKSFYGGYGWAFPKDGIVNIGVGIRHGKKISISDKLRWLTKKLMDDGYIDKDSSPISSTGGLIPVGGFLPSLGRENIILVGDAAGATHPITGGGIANAVLTGEFAGDAIIKYFNGKARNPLEYYQKNVLGFLGNSIEHAFNKRGYMEKNWDSKDFSQVISKTWISFGDYGKKD